MSHQIDIARKRSPLAPYRPLCSPQPATPATPATRAILSLGERDCRWPMGELDDEDFCFCRLRRDLGSAYCPAHRRASHAGAIR